MRKGLKKMKRQVKRLAKNRDGESKKSSAEQAQENRYDKKSRKNNMKCEAAKAANGGGSINASLRISYRQVQQTREIKEKIAPVAVTAALTANRAKMEAEQQKQQQQQEQQQKAQEQAQQQPEAQEQVLPKGDQQPVNSSTNEKPPSKPPGRKKSSKQLSSTDKAVTAIFSLVSHPLEPGGMSNVLKQTKQLIKYPMIRPEFHHHLGIDPSRGVLLRGLSGYGKSHLTNAIAGELGVPYFWVSASKLVSSMSDKSEGRIRELFQVASQSAPSLIFMNELDAIAPKRDDLGGGKRGMEKCMVTQLLTCLDLLDPQID